MDINDHKALAEKLESNVKALLNDFSSVLGKHGFAEFRVVSFSVGHRSESKHVAFAGTPCPTKCKAMPDGTVECFPDCS